MEIYFGSRRSKFLAGVKEMVNALYFAAKLYLESPQISEHRIEYYAERVANKCSWLVNTVWGSSMEHLGRHVAPHISKSCSTVGTNGLKGSSSSPLLLQMAYLHASLDQSMATNMTHTCLQDQNSFQSCKSSCHLLVVTQFTPSMLTQPTHNHFRFLVDTEICRLVQTKHLGTQKCPRFARWWSGDLQAF